MCVFLPGNPPQRQRLTLPDVCHSLEPSTTLSLPLRTDETDSEKRKYTCMWHSAWCETFLFIDICLLSHCHSADCSPVSGLSFFFFVKGTQKIISYNVMWYLKYETTGAWCWQVRYMCSPDPADSEKIFIWGICSDLGNTHMNFIQMLTYNATGGSQTWCPGAVYILTIS